MNNSVDLTSFTQETKSLFSDRLISVIVYGTENLDEYLASAAQENLLVVLSSVTFNDLKIFKPLYSKIYKKYNFEPLLLSEETLFSSADIFPIEFLSMKDSYTVLFGKDIFKDLEIELSNLRLQCELTLKSKLIVLRQEYLIGEPESSLLMRSFPVFMKVLGNILRLKEHAVPSDSSEILSKIEHYFSVDMKVFEDIKGLLSQRRPDKKQLTGLFDSYLSILTELEQKIDSFQV